ncbi:hypothetical protein GGG16DRAFT_52101 [Schizophyllum commune]
MSVSFPPPPPLPQELLEIIFRYLVTESPRSLSACAQAHRRLTSIAQSILYHTIRLTSGKRLISFVRTLEYFPHLAVLVRQLLIAQPSPLAFQRGQLQHRKSTPIDLERLNVVFPNLIALAVRCARLHLTTSAKKGHRGMVAAPRGVNAFIARCAPTLRVLELDYDADGLTTYKPYDRSRNVCLPALHTLVLNHIELSTDHIFRACVRAAPNIDRLVLWTGFTARHVGNLRINDEGVEYDGGRSRTQLKTAVIEGWRALRRIELVMYARDPLGGLRESAGAREGVLVGVLPCSDGREVEVFVVQIPRGKMPTTFARRIQRTDGGVAVPGSHGRTPMRPPLLAFNVPSN